MPVMEMLGTSDLKLMSLGCERSDGTVEIRLHGILVRSG